MMEHSHAFERPLTDERPGAPHDPLIDRGEIEGSDLTRSDTERSPSPGQELPETGLQDEMLETPRNPAKKRSAGVRKKASPKNRKAKIKKTTATRKSRASARKGRSVSKKSLRKRRSSRVRTKSVAK